MENPYKINDKVLTKVKGADVEATVVQVFKHEVQVKTSDGKMLWRTMHTVWFSGSEPIPKPAKVFPVSATEQPATTPAVETGAEAGVGSVEAPPAADTTSEFVPGNTAEPTPEPTPVPTPTPEPSTRTASKKAHTGRGHGKSGKKRNRAR